MSEATPTHRRLSGERLDAVLDRLGPLPTLASVLARAQAVSTGPQERGGLLRIARSDAALAANLLTAANRARPRSARTLRQALVALGEEAARAVVLATPVLPPAGGAPAADGRSPAALWRHALAAAAAAEMLARRIDPAIDADEALTCGLLHDLGKLALRALMPKAYDRVPAAEGGAGGAAREREILGTDHATVGRRLAERRGWPDVLAHVLWLSHHPLDALPASLPAADRRLIAIVQLADTLAHEQGGQVSGEGAFARGGVEAAREIDGEGAYREVAERLAEEVARRRDALGLPAGGEGQGDAAAVLADLHAALARENERLRRRAGELAEPAAAFACLRDLVAALDPRAPLWKLLAEAGRAAASAAGLCLSPAQPLVAYVLGGDDASVLAVRLDGGKPAVRTLARALPGESPPAPAGGGVERALGGLLADTDALSDWLPPGCVHRPLVCGGAWVGGLLEAPAPQAAGRGEIADAAAAACGAVLAAARARARAVRLGEELAGTAQALAAAREALAQARTLAAVGEMAAGAAHEINTPLAVISGRAQLMRDRAADEDARRTWEQIAEQAQHVSDLITALMEFASPPRPSPQPLDAREMLEEAVAALRAEHATKALPARVDIQVGQEVPRLFADRKQVRTVLVELLRNAAAAGSETEIRLSAEADEANDAVLLTVQDDGRGMDAETLAGAFTPFFSSQRAGRRRGLGLPRARRFAENNGGCLRLRSRPGEGTTATVRLPRASV